MKLITSVFLLASISALTACEKKAVTADPKPVDVADAVLAKVGDSTIYQSDLDALTERLSPDAQRQITSAVRANMTQSLVRARVLAVAGEKQMTADEKRLLEAKVRAFRDEVLAKHYIQSSVEAQPVTTQMVKEYYAKHQAEYSTPGNVDYQYLHTTQTDLDEALRKKVLSAFGEAGKQKYLKQYAEQLVKKGLPVAFKTAKLPLEKIDSVIKTQVQQLTDGQTSAVIYADRLYVVKVIAKAASTPIPLANVSAGIRAKLAPIQLKNAVSESAQTLMQELDIQIMEK